jgi:hypothetical protein
MDLRLFFWDFIYRNPWSAFFTLLFVISGIRRICLQCSGRMTIAILVILGGILGAITFSAKMLYFVDAHPFIYWLILCVLSFWTEMDAISHKRK